MNTKYKILTAHRSEILEELVNEHLEQGWGLRGYLSNFKFEPYHSQTVIKHFSHWELEKYNETIR